ncbi:MAG: DUF6502 family protein [Gammaproteobacteria bacterium]
MTQKVSKALSAAILRMLRPLVRILLRHGISYGTFADLAKWVYVDVADKEFNLPGRKQSVSRVSIITGLSRKEVSRIQAIETPDDEGVVQKYNRAARVISGWLRDKRFNKSDGKPEILPLEGENSFAELVKAYSGDIPSRAVLDELERVKAVELVDGKVRLLTHAYVPAEGEEEKLHILGTDVALLINTINHNLENAQEPQFQRKVAYDNLPEEILPQLREVSREKAQALLEELDRQLVKHDRDSNPDSKGSGRKRAGLGIYYFEEDVSEDK